MYNKDNIDGVIFTYSTKSTRYKIEKIDDENVRIHWNIELGDINIGSTMYSMYTVLRYFNDGSWKVEKPSFSIVENFPIY